MYSSRVKIVPDQQLRLNQSLGRLNQVYLSMMQKDQAEMLRGIDEYKKIVDNSFKPVYGKYQQEYLAKRDEFIKEAGQIYRDNNYRNLTPEQHRRISERYNELILFADKANEVRKLFNESVNKVMFNTDGKIRRKESLANLVQVENMSLDDALDYLESGIWAVAAPPKFDFIAERGKILKQSKVDVDDIKRHYPDYVLVEGKQYYDPTKFKELTRMLWDSGKEALYQQFPDYETFERFMRPPDGESEPIKIDYKTKKVDSKGGSNTGKVTIINPSTHLGYTVWDIESVEKHKPYTVSKGMELYTEDGELVSVDEAAGGRLIRFAERDFGMGKKLYAVFRGDSGYPLNVLFIKDKVADDDTNKQLRENKKILYIPFEQLGDGYLDSIGIKLEGLENVFKGKRGLLDGANFNLKNNER